jgi:glycine/D-amino acid oxidase-like deaminating enzyme
VGIVGGGIIGASAAAFLAEAGASVILVERDDIGAAASGRNSGVIQHPFDPDLAALYHDTLRLYRDLEVRDAGFRLPRQPAGLLLLSADEEEVRVAASAIATRAAELDPEVIAPAQLRLTEPGLADDLWACRLTTGHPVAPAAATSAFAARARRAGARVVVGVSDAAVALDGTRAVGLRYGPGEEVPCAAVLVAAGPWTPQLVPGWREGPPITSLWGVVVSVQLPGAPHHVLEELGIDRPGSPPDELFSLVPAGVYTSVGSTFLAARPDADGRAVRVLERAVRFVSALRGADVRGVRVCARPRSFDGRPLIGPVPEYQNLYVCAGHGPWGISTGPASAELVAAQILGRSNGENPFSAARVAAMS